MKNTVMKNTLVQSRVAAHTVVSATENIFCLCLHVPAVAAVCRPGQFVMLYLGRGDLLLPRPISIHDAEGEHISLIYKVVGAGTAHLQTFKPGDALTLLGPLGNGFTLPAERAHVALVGGGIGIPPLYFALRKLGHCAVDACLGYRDAAILAEDFGKHRHCANVSLASESGRHGLKGNVMDLLSGQTFDGILACGPKPMLRAVAQWAQSHGIPCQVCMEERMACGLGTCMGCVAATADGYRRVCCEGPVFDALTIEWGDEW